MAAYLLRASTIGPWDHTRAADVPSRNRNELPEDHSLRGVLPLFYFIFYIFSVYFRIFSSLSFLFFYTLPLCFTPGLQPHFSNVQRGQPEEKEGNMEPPRRQGKKGEPEARQRETERRWPH